MQPKLNILFICTGNTCRSPMAEYLLKHYLEQKHIDDRVQVRSAGIAAHNGTHASKHTIQVLNKRGIHAKAHRSTQVTEDKIAVADLILTMTSAHKQWLIQMYPSVCDKTYTLKEFVNAEPESEERMERITSLMADIELKQATFWNRYRDELEALQVQGKQEELQNRVVQLQTELDQQLKDEQRTLHELLQTLPDVDISDPFGGDAERYEESAKELERAINQLIDRIEARLNEPNL